MATIDVTAMMQGIWDARDNSTMSQEFADQIYEAICEITYRGKVGRRVCDYNKLLVALSTVEPEDWIELVRLWEYLGKSLASGISVAAN